MLRITLKVLDHGRAIHAIVHEGISDAAIGALSAEPTTIAELLAAMQRFVEPPAIDHLNSPSLDSKDEDPSADGSLMIDLTAKMLVNEVPGMEIPRLGTILHCNEHTTLDVRLPYRIPDDWWLTADVDLWNAVAQKRRHDLAKSPPLDARATLYGKLADALIRRWQVWVGKTDDPVMEVQSWWLLTRRKDLGDRSPREILLANNDFIDRDIEDQGQIWRQLGHSPPGISTQSTAYRYGGFGTHEIILYHEMTTMMLIECGRRISADCDIDITSEIRHLEQFQQQWLNRPHEDLFCQSPAAMIACERARLPAVIPDDEEHGDDDCPLCRMMDESDQPRIWRLHDGLLDQQFATSFYKSRADWERDQSQWEEENPRVGADEVMPWDADLVDEERVWQCGYTNMNALQDSPPAEVVAVMTIAIGNHLAELLEDLSLERDSNSAITDLHHGFDDLLMRLKERKEMWLIEASIHEFCETLDQISKSRNPLHRKCEDLKGKLRFLVDQYAQDLENVER